MKRILIAALTLPTLAAGPAPAPLTAGQTERIRCVAALALVANDQQRGAPGWERFPWLPERGKHFAGVTGDALVTETARDREAIKAEILSAIAVLQKTPKPATEAIARSCIALMDKLDPPAVPPTLPQCAAMVALASQEVSGREGNSRASKELSILASILDGKAREQLLAEGKSGTESDVIIGMEKEAMIAQAKVNRARGETDNLDIETCFAMAGRK